MILSSCHVLTMIFSMAVSVDQRVLSGELQQGLKANLILLDVTFTGMLMALRGKLQMKRQPHCLMIRVS